MSSSRHITAETPILVVDDSRIDRSMACIALEKLGYSVKEAKGGQECLDYCSKQPPLLVVMDMTMPDHDGVSVCEQIRKNYSKEDLPIIILTGTEEEENIETALRAGANDFISKPINLKVLKARIENQLAFSNLYRALQHDRVQLERTLAIQRAVGDVLPDGLLLNDAFGKIIYANQELQSLYDDKLPEKIDQVFATFFGGQLKSELASLLAQANKNPSCYLDKEFEFKRRVEGPRVIKVASKPVSGRGAGLRLWLIRDLSHVRNLERRIADQIKLKSVSTFATGVAHNFNNILGSIKSSKEVLKRYAKDLPVIDRCFKIIDQAVDQGEQLTKKMACLTTRNTMSKTKKEENLSHLVTSVVEVQSQLVGPRINFCLELAEQIPRINADTQNVIDIITSVVRNSVEAIPEQGTIAIQSKYVPGAPTVSLEVIDNGCGMTEDVLKRAHEPFFSTKHMDHVNGVSTVGNGLGLWNVYNLLKMIGGEIHLESSKGEGTRAELIFPVIQ